MLTIKRQQSARLVSRRYAPQILLSRRTPGESDLLFSGGWLPNLSGTKNRMTGEIPR